VPLAEDTVSIVSDQARRGKGCKLCQKRCILNVYSPRLTLPSEDHNGV
jgi:hypothetical protein